MAAEPNAPEGPPSGDPLFQTIPEPIEFERVSRPRPARRFSGFKWLSIGVLIGVIGFGGWWGYKALTAGGGTEEAKAPIVHAIPDPIKVRPDNPGGMEVPNQDKLIYERLGEKDAPPSQERLLPQPEQPLPRPVPAPVLVNPPPLPQPVPSPAPDSGKPTALVPPAPPPPPVAEPPRVEEKSAPVVAAPKAAPLPTPTPAPAPKAAGGKSVQVQLGAVRSEAEAQKEWNRLKTKHADQLGGLELTVEKADLGAKGIFYRLRAGPVPDEATAAQMCAQLTVQKVACLVVK